MGVLLSYVSITEYGTISGYCESLTIKKKHCFVYFYIALEIIELNLAVKKREDQPSISHNLFTGLG